MQFSEQNKFGIITCPSKSRKPKHLIKNWRPTTILNVVYKLALGCIDDRIKTILDKLINQDQT